MRRLLLVALALAVAAAATALVVRAATGGDDGESAAGSCAVTLTFGGRDYLGLEPGALSRFTLGAELGRGTHPLDCRDTVQDPPGPETDPAPPRVEAVTVHALVGVDPASAVAGTIGPEGGGATLVWFRGPRCARSASTDALVTCLLTPSDGG